MDEREGGDIFAADMQQPELISKIAAGFEDSTVFLTGSTGYLGQMFLEKLLRLSKTVKVFILVRPKKGKDTRTRFREIFEGPNMVPLKLKNRNFDQQVRLINGDCVEKDLGLSNEDKQMLIEEVNYIIHCAATVRFNQELRTAARINVRAVRDLLAMAKQMRNLKAFLHVSTAFSFCPRKVIDEEIYEPGMKGEDLMHMVETMSQARLAAITPSLVKDWPNTYSFTKAIAEDSLRREAGRLPIAILRPSIVVGSVAEPLVGWIDNCYGVTGAFAAIGVGLMRCSLAKLDYKTDLIPADYVINAGFAAIWDVAQRKSLNDNMEFPEEEEDKEIAIYNVVSSSESPIEWGYYRILFDRESRKIPFSVAYWYPFNIWTSNRFVFSILNLILHTIPAYLIDGLCFLIRKERKIVERYQKMSKFMEFIAYFSMREWKFTNKNLQALWCKLDPEDRRVFPFSMKNFDWRNYMHSNVRGVRVYVMKDPLESLETGRTKYKLLGIAHCTLVSVLVLSMAILFHHIWKIFV